MRCITLNPSSWGSVTVAQKSHKLQVGGSTPPPASSPCIPTVEKVDLESIQCKFESYQGHLTIKSKRFMIVLCGISSVVERHPSKLDVTGSNPVFRSEPYTVLYCLIAQLAEHGAVNSGVLGSSPSGAVDRVGNVRFYHKSLDHHIRLTKS